LDGGNGGAFLATVRVCDGHTDSTIDFNAGKYQNELTFDNSAVRIYQKDKTDTAAISYTKKTDRWAFDFNTKVAETTKTFIVESTQYIDIIESDYKGHLITGTKWVDFEEKDVYKVDVKRITNKKVEVTVYSGKLKSSWNFNSIGELNCVTESRQFFSVNRTYAFTSPILAGGSNTYYYNMTYNASWITSMDTDLWYNGTEYSMVESCSSTLCQYSRTLNAATLFEDNISVNFEYEINGVIDWDNQSQETFIPIIDDCTPQTTGFVNYTLRDEQNNSIRTGDMDYYFNWTSGTYTGSFNGTNASVDTLEFCIYPNWANFTADITIQYSATGYDARDYVVDNYQVDNVTDYINLYMLTTGASTEITIHVIDEKDDDLANVFIEAYRWDIPTNEDRLVETEYTDSDGNAIFDLQTGSTYYSFRFYQGGVLQLTTTRFKIFSTTLEYILRGSETTVLQEWLEISDITASITYSNTTRLVTYTWDDTSSVADNFCLNITSYNQTYYSGCLATASGSLNYTLPDFNVSYVAQGLARYSGTNRYYVIASRTIHLFRDWRTYLGGDNSLTAAIFIHLVVSLLLITNKNSMIIGNLAAIIMLYLFNISPFGLGTVTLLCTMGIVLLFITNKRREP